MNDCHCQTTAFRSKLCVWDISPSIAWSGRAGGRGGGGGGARGGGRCRERKRWRAGSVLNGLERALVNQTETGTVSLGAAMGPTVPVLMQFRFGCVFKRFRGVSNSLDLN